MAKKVDFKGALGGIIDENKEEQHLDDSTTQEVHDKATNDTPFILEKKKKKKKNTKKSFPLYMDESKVNELDKICNKTGYTRNELINLMIDFGLRNLQIK